MKNKIHTDESNIENYNKTGKLYGNCIECNHCSSQITMFGSNLENRIVKFGSLENLLKEFTCRSCKSAAKPKKVMVRVKREKKEKTETVYNVPKMIVSEKRNVLLSSAPDIIQSVSMNGSCIRPDIFLNNGRNCNGCTLFDHCLASIKTLVK